ncbi:MAG: UDP-glucose 4-epimerase GalE [Jatrophihabitans sp.]|uniref:UDP-glucose 4-epimerase GalE n=1 Tax=Jatrophihabitans sp. TaxID=1932789 RepID=UPI00391319D2
MRVLVTGGAGYIGSHTVVHLVAAGHEPVIVDNFGNSKPAVINRLEKLTGAPIDVHAFDLRDAALVGALFESDRFDAVIHFAGLKAVAESVAHPLSYYDNNLASTVTLVRAMSRHRVPVLVFSSSATVYGADVANPATEDAPTSAANPYGWTKVMIEQILRDVAASEPRFAVALLRYFNPAGAHPSGDIGEDPLAPPANLVPRIAQLAAGHFETLPVFGTDYPTADGTCVRDFVHVEDLAAGHVAALDHLARAGSGVHTWNLGTGTGTTVLQMVAAFSRAVGHALPWEPRPRRPGDVAASYADVSRARHELGWSATRSVDEMCADAWRWQSQNPAGYPDTEQEDDA